MNILMISLLCVCVLVGGVAARDIDADKLARVIADALEKAQDQVVDDDPKTGADAIEKSQENQNEKVAESEEGESGEIPDKEIIDLLQVAVDEMKSEAEMAGESDTRRDEDLDEDDQHKLYRRSPWGWLRKVVQKLCQVNRRICRHWGGRLHCYHRLVNVVCG